MDHLPNHEPISIQMSSTSLVHYVRSYHRHTLHFDEKNRDISWKSKQGPTWQHQYHGNPTPYTTLDSQSNPMNPFNNPTCTQHATNASELYEATDDTQDLFRVQSTLADEGLVGIIYLWKWVKRMLVLPYWQQRVCVSFASDIPAGGVQWYTIGISISEDEVTLCIKDRIWEITIARLLAADLEDVSPFASISSWAIASDPDSDTESPTPSVPFTAMVSSSPTSSTCSSLSSLSSISSTASYFQIVMSPTPPPQVPASPSVYRPSSSSSRSESPSYMRTPPTSEAYRPEPVFRFKVRRIRTSQTSSISPGTSLDHIDDDYRKSPAVSAVDSDSEDSGLPDTYPRKRRAMGRSTRTNSSRRKRHKGDSTGPSSRMDPSITASPSLATSILCSNCFALLPSEHLDQRPVGPFSGQRDPARHTPISEVSSDIKDSINFGKVIRADERKRRSRSSVLEDLVPVSIRTRSTIRVSAMKEKRRSDNSLSAIDKFIAELNDEEQSSDPESDSESSIESDDIVWDESRSPFTQSSGHEYHSPINARTRSTRQNSTISEQRPTNDLLSSLLDFMDDLNESEDISMELEAGTVAG